MFATNSKREESDFKARYFFGWFKMPKLKDFSIEFDKAGATYAPGETVTGRVIIKLSKPKNVKGKFLLS